ncbi:hypothetical protein [Flavihumibacter profundi]|uniref:hypothetical protein n=1 Tax=Flavihumibacter profundi TaxID=2716883 RepID=UPI001CC3A670|nr:hypothetical protein [Flavihumibacter profundi]MBZ5856720.1 hypothetical protein [Flavihumibacter profundi]
MKKVITIFFLTVYLLSTTEAHQLLKLPVVFEHFKEHRQEDKSISLLHFLAIHYLHGSPRDKDYDRDMQLPFKTSNDCISVTAPAFIPLSVELSVIQPVDLPQKKNFIIDDQFILPPYLSIIWQPPKSC